MSASTTVTSSATSLGSASVTSTHFRTADSQPTSLDSTSTSKTNVGAIAGGVIGGVFALIGLVAIVLFCLRRRRLGATGQEHSITVDSNEKYVVDPTGDAHLNASAVSNKHVITMNYVLY